MTYDGVSRAVAIFSGISAVFNAKRVGWAPFIAIPARAFAFLVVIFLGLFPIC